MKNEKKVLIISAVDPTRAYSCIQYLYYKLLEKNVDLECWARVPKSSRESYKKWGKEAHTFFNCFLMNVPKIRTQYMKIYGFFKCLQYRNKIIICHDLFHYPACCYVKKHYPDTKLILYFTEIFNKNHVMLMQNLQHYFEKNPNNMDLMIECDFKREEYRIETNHIVKPTVTILNTIPMEDVNKYKINKKIKNSRPIIVYSGGIHQDGEFDVIIDALQKIDMNFELDFYCFGNDSLLATLNKECEEKLPGKYRITANLPRDAVMEKIYNADIGITYYDPTESINTKYAAPTKFFEYLGLEVPIVCSGNPSLTNLIDKYGLGTYMKENNVDGLSDAIFELLNSESKRQEISKNEKVAFEKYLCYEIQSQNGINKIMDIINQ